MIKNIIKWARQSNAREIHIGGLIITVTYPANYVGWSALALLVLIIISIKLFF